MATRRVKPTSPGRRFQAYSSFEEKTKTKPEKQLLKVIKKSGGRNAKGRITSRHRGGGHKQHYRIVDFRRDKDNIEAIIVGGANNIYEQEEDYQDNIEAITKELFSHHIKIEKEFLGGISERSIMYDTRRNELFIKKKWEDQFRNVIYSQL